LSPPYGTGREVNKKKMRRKPVNEILTDCGEKTFKWQEDCDDPNDQHRQTFHLFVVYSGRQINIVKTPEMDNAAFLSLRSSSGNN
jgi:hypothetical protein